MNLQAEACLPFIDPQLIAPKVFADGIQEGFYAACPNKHRAFDQLHEGDQCILEDILCLQVIAPHFMHQVAYREIILPGNIIKHPVVPAADPVEELVFGVFDWGFLQRISS